MGIDDALSDERFEFRSGIADSDQGDSLLDAVPAVDGLVVLKSVT